MSRTARRRPQAAPARSLQADFNSDGADDLAVGVPLDNVGAVVGAGAVNILYGSATGLSSTGSQLFTQVPGRPGPGDEFAASLASGDFNGDTFADVAAGTPLEEVVGADAAGTVTALFGSPTGLSGTGSQLFTQVGGAVEPGDGFGFALTTGNFNSDTFADLAAGAPFEQVGSVAEAGAVSALPGSANGLTSTGGQLFTQASPGVPGSAQEFDLFGFTLTTGDPVPRRRRPQRPRRRGPVRGHGKPPRLAKRLPHPDLLQASAGTTSTFLDDKSWKRRRGRAGEEGTP